MQRREDLAIEKLVAELRVQPFAIAIPPRASRFDVERLDADPAEPLTHADRNKFWAVVGANVLRRSVCDEEVGQTVEHVIGNIMANVAKSDVGRRYDYFWKYLPGSC
ncbi:Transposase IS3/IS911 family protein [Hyphomicrobium denitrificans 1NES1]|uniref:Transposase IS3/IS911 family protein n=1 Tax=Hyphomicrobium denitrificans 1NES1 TaxID=670307 RepID=N0B1T8_9HYPH|nr:Transposase IS3/IS911 family protein [Hyphomicrobium denitrificans 1NES1]